MTEPPPSETLSGAIERVTFHNEDNGFSILKVAVKGQKEPVSMLGHLAQANPGEHVVAEGRWEVDRTHGRQFRATLLRATPPDSPEGIEKFLGSGLVKGIGPVYAKKLVARFGKDVLNIIDQRSAKLEEVDGIGPTRRKAIKESWQEAKLVREIMTFLMSHGVSTARAFRIHKTYGEEAMMKVQADPYCLARDIRGIGFKTADEIARHFGIDANSPLRARAGVEHVLAENAGQGHCAFPRDELARQSAELLGIDPAIVEDAILHGLAEKRLILETRLADNPLVYLQHMHRAETELAEDLRRLREAPLPFDTIDAPKALAWVQKQIRMELAPRQQEAVSTALRSKVMVITGGPGVGKTTIVNAIIRIFKARQLKVRLAAPTGRAAKRLSETSGEHAMTVHRLLVFDPASGGFKHNRSHPLSGDVFIIDESSMLDLQLAHQVIRALPEKALLLLVGDVDQLPSVGPGSVLRDVIESGSVPVCRLTEIFRQAQNSAIIVNAHRINQGEYPVSSSQQYPGDFYIVPAEEPGQVWAKIRGLMTGALKKSFGMDPLRDAQILTPMQRGGLGARALNSEIQALVNPRGDFVERFGVTFRVGDRVMQTLNNYDKDVFNGDMGHIVSIDPMERELWVDMGGQKINYSFNELDELVLSYAITIHKSQGSEYPCVILPLHTQHYMMLQRNLLYTAVTRGKRLVIVVGSPKAISMALSRADTRLRIGCLRQRLGA